jgi:peroxiredoxin
MKIKILFFILLLILICSNIHAQGSRNFPPSPDDKFPGFTLPVYQGGTYSLNQTHGKNVLLIVSRGMYSEGHWCAICDQQYADFVSLARKDSIREKYNLSVIFLMPYSKDILKDWENSFIQDLKKIENWKYPKDTTNQTEDQKKWSTYAKYKFPKTHEFPDNKADLLLPILMDEKQELSNKLGIFRTEWDGGKGAQNVPSIFLINDKGVLVFKYISQNTFDRPSPEYIMNIIQKMVIR